MSRVVLNKGAITAVAGLITFGAGLLVLRFNPFWRSEPGFPGYLDHHVYAWSGIGHLICALGLFCTFGALIYLVSRAFSTQWPYWITVALGIVAITPTTGLSKTYSMRWDWDANRGVTQLRVVDAEEGPANRVWQSVVRWQVEPELKGWLGSSENKLRQTHGYLVIRVVRFVPVAGPTTLDCDCFGCCREDSGSAPSGQ